MMLWKGWSADEERWIMGIEQRMVWKGYDEEIVQKRYLHKRYLEKTVLSKRYLEKLRKEPLYTVFA